MTTSDPLDRELHTLFNQYCEGVLESEGQRRLEAILWSDSAARAEFYLFIDLHGGLAWANGAAGSREMLVRLDRAAAPPIAAPPLEPPSRALQAMLYLSSPVRFGVLVATVTCVSLLLTAAQFRLGEAPDRVPTRTTTRTTTPAAAPAAIAQLVRGADCRWEGAAPSRTLAAGTTLRLAAGTAKVTFARGAQATFWGPCELCVLTAESVRFERGKFRVKAPSEAVGFTAFTPMAEIVDLGTEFGVQVDEARGEVQVEVRQGLVEIRPRAADGRGAARIARAGDACKLTRAAAQAEPTFLWTARSAATLRELTKQIPPQFPSEPIADYGADFAAFSKQAVQNRAQQESPRNWKFFFNRQGPLGEPRHYEPMVWNESLKCFHPPVAEPPQSWQFGLPAPLGFARLHSWGGHPGVGADHSPRGTFKFDYYVMARYEIPEAGRYALAQSWLRLARKPKEFLPAPPTVRLAVYLNDEATPRLVRIAESGASRVPFNVDLGRLEAGDFVWVAVGPDGSHAFDTFEWNFQVVKEVSAAAPVSASEAQEDS